MSDFRTYQGKIRDFGIYPYEYCSQNYRKDDKKSILEGVTYCLPLTVTEPCILGEKLVKSSVCPIGD